MSPPCKGKAPGPPPPARRSVLRTLTAAKTDGTTSLAKALQLHQFKRTNVETIVSTRSDVELAVKQIVPSRVRNANKVWREALAAEASTFHAGHSKKRLRVTFPDVHTSDSFPLEQVHTIEASMELCSCTSVLSLGAGVSRKYREVLIARITAAGQRNDPSNSVKPSWPPLPANHSPDAAWQELRDFQQFLPVTAAWATPTGANADGAAVTLSLEPRAANMIRFVCISDTHGRHHGLTPLMPPGDVLLHAGDFSMKGGLPEVTDFGLWLASLPYERKFVIAGNHDVSFDAAWCEENGVQDSELANEVRRALTKPGGDSVVYLENQEASFKGIRIFGSPCQPKFGAWAFQASRGPASACIWASIPEGIDILLVHGPPLGRGDICQPRGNHVGCADLLEVVQCRVRPAFCVSGHIHEDYGMSNDGNTTFLNAASQGPGFLSGCDRPPLIFDVAAKE